MFYLIVNNQVQCADYKFSREGKEYPSLTMDEYVQHPNKVIIVDGELQPNPNYEQEEAEKERQRKDNMSLTPADVWRALYKAKQMRSTDLLQLIEEQMTGIDMNLVEIEFGASSFYRGAKLGNGRLFDVIGGLLGYTSDDMDYLFEHKELPVKNEIDYSKLTVAQLKALADERGISYPSNILKADLIALLEAN